MLRRFGGATGSGLGSAFLLGRARFLGPADGAGVSSSTDSERSLLERPAVSINSRVKRGQIKTERFIDLRYIYIYRCSN